MTILILIVLGFVQGLTEFLPVSSSGHLVLLSRVFGVNDSLFVSIILHVATLLAVLVVLRKEVFQLLRHPFSTEAMKLYLATIPTCIIALLIMPLINTAFEGALLPVCFLISAGLLLFSDYKTKKQTNDSLTFKHAFIMGIVQGFAIFPGISRSGSTIASGLIAGASREKTAKFSFLMSIPIILLSMLLEIIKIFVYKQTIEVDILGVILAFIMAFVIGIISIKFMLKITQKSKFKLFSIYLVVIALVSMFI